MLVVVVGREEFASKFVELVRGGTLCLCDLLGSDGVASNREERIHFMCHACCAVLLEVSALGLGFTEAEAELAWAGFSGDEH